ncbi:KH domain-containing protein [Granulicella aggregans]|uniref:KH domain-containing protein n=1 Tax=Granulicella aggregans TaxID=474949 RepID=UPI0021E0AA7A|nr:KH domain-containing protein [Granulicella aggregans]
MPNIRATVVPRQDMPEVRVQTGDPYVETARLLIEQVLRLIAGVPDEIEVRAAVAEAITVFKVRVAREDVGRVIGSDQRTIHALRMILGAVGLRYKQRFVLEVEEYPE